MSIVEFTIKDTVLTYKQINPPDFQRGINIINLTVEALKNEHFPDNLELQWVVFAGDTPYTVDIVLQQNRLHLKDHYKHIFSIAEPVGNSHKAYPCFMFDSWEECGIPDYEKMIDLIEEKGITTPYLYDKMFYRGAPSIPKSRFCALGQRYSWIDAFETYNLSIRPASLHCANRIELSEHIKWKYLIDIGGGKYGDGYSARLKAFMFSNRVVFIQHRPCGDMTYDLFKDGENCIFIKEDFSDLEEKYKWIESKGEEFQKNMAKNLLNVGRSNCRRINAYERIRSIVRTLIENEKPT